MTTIEGMRPRVEIYSINDAFCDLTFAGQGIQQQWQMKREILLPRDTTSSESDNILGGSWPLCARSGQLFSRYAFLQQTHFFIKPFSYSPHFKTILRSGAVN